MFMYSAFGAEAIWSPGLVLIWGTQHYSSYMAPCDDLSGLEAGRCNEKRRRGDLEASAPFHPRHASILGGEHGPMLEHASFCLLDWLLGPVFRNWFISYWFISIHFFWGGGILEKIILGGQQIFIWALVQLASLWDSGYGASAICPYLSLAHIRRWHATDTGHGRCRGTSWQGVGDVSPCPLQTWLLWLSKISEDHDINTTGVAACHH
jgi:hypothetical protein